MVLRVIKSTQLEALYPLPPRSIQLVSSGSAASAPPPPSLPSSSSTASLAHFVLPSGSTNLRHSIGPQAAPAVSSRRKAKSLPVIQLSWDDGESLALRAKSDEDHARLLKVLGEPTDEDEESDEVEAQSRKDRESLDRGSRLLFEDELTVLLYLSSRSRIRESAPSRACQGSNHFLSCYLLSDNAA